MSSKLLSEDLRNASRKFAEEIMQTTVYKQFQITHSAILGNEVATLVNEKQNAGSHSVEWDAGNYSSCIYFYKLSSGEFKDTKRMILLK